VTNTPKRTPPFRQPKFEGIPTLGSTSTQKATTKGAISDNLSQVYTPCRGGSSPVFGMVGHDHTIRLPEFRGEVAEDPKKYMSICAKIWEA
jgi:hypothetical protein